MPNGMLDDDAVQEPGPVGEATEHHLDSFKEAAGGHAKAVVVYADKSSRASQEAASGDIKASQGGGGGGGGGGGKLHGGSGGVVGFDDGERGSKVGSDAKPARRVHMLPDPVEVPTPQSRMQSALWQPITPFGSGQAQGIQNRTDAASIVVHYQGDCFADEDDDVSSTHIMCGPHVNMLLTAKLNLNMNSRSETIQYVT